MSSCCLRLRVLLLCACLAFPMYILTLTSLSGGGSGEQFITIISQQPRTSLPEKLVHNSPSSSRSSSTSSIRRSMVTESSSSSSDYSAVAAAIATKWSLTHPDAVRLLELQFHRKIDQYNPTTDFLHFHHIAKTGGTSISDLMNATLGPIGGILPGSHRSGEFNSSAMYDFLNASDPTKTVSFLASYAHTRLRPIHGPGQTELSKFFEQYFALSYNIKSQRKLRSLAMIREPTDLRASTYAMAMCSLNGRVNDYNYARRRRGLEKVCNPDKGLNISSLWDGIVVSAMNKCNNSTSNGGIKMDRYDKFLCNHGPSAMDYCRGPTELLNSVQYRIGMRSMYRGLMGRYVGRERMLSPVYHSLNDPETHHHHHNNKRRLDDAAIGDAIEQGVPVTRGMIRQKTIESSNFGSYTPDEVERYTLIDLGGLDPDRITYEPDTIRQVVNDDNNNNNNDEMAEPDFLWFGITERMHESVCLFAYTLSVPMPKQGAPRARIMACPTTSWWTESHRDEVRAKEPYDYAVWRTANAILDVRIMKMKSDVQQRLEKKDIGGRSLTHDERLRHQSLVDAGCLK